MSKPFNLQAVLAMFLNFWSTLLGET